ncbi:hypothetical protein WJX73_006486 [Symbiochloris irregularis]|uniref:Protein kinase domain-containing protein n=1 Tax=Symbiochloris irregularis TaxID=706552 RepID=A0AAW1NWR5_9CHLO
MLELFSSWAQPQAARGRLGSILAADRKSIAADCFQGPLHLEHALGYQYGQGAHQSGEKSALHGGTKPYWSFSQGRPDETASRTLATPHPTSQLLHSDMLHKAQTQAKSEECQAQLRWYQQASQGWEAAFESLLSEKRTLEVSLQQCQENINLCRQDSAKKDNEIQQLNFAKWQQETKLRQNELELHANLLTGQLAHSKAQTVRQFEAPKTVLQSWPPANLSLAEVIPGKAIGEGTFGMVAEADHEDPIGQTLHVALKVAQEKDDDPDLTQQARVSLTNEAAVLTKLGFCRHIVRLRGVCYLRADVPEAERGRVLGIVTDYYSGGDVWECHRAHVAAGGCMPRWLSWRIAECGAMGLKHIASQGHAHCDFKLGNLLLSRTVVPGSKRMVIHAKVADLGGAADLEGKPCKVGVARGTPLYAPPEQNFTVPPTAYPTTDVWSWGASVLETLCPGKLQKLLKFQTNLVANGKALPTRLPLPRLGAPFDELLGPCFCRDPGDRPSMADRLDLMSQTKAAAKQDPTLYAAIFGP